jgi:hypothetical protein
VEFVGFIMPNVEAGAAGYYEAQATRGLLNASEAFLCFSRDSIFW